MKNLYFLAAVAAFVLGSCTVEEALDPPANPEDEVRAIGFGTFLDRAPQNGIKPLASVMYIGGLKSRNPGFMVQAYKHAKGDWNEWNDVAQTATTPNLMSAQTVTWRASGSSWTYSPIKYWPRSDSNWDKVSLFAYIPTTGSVGVTFAPAKAEYENPKLYCTVPSAYSTQVDLIVDAEYNLTGESDKVTFKFDHVLSRIGFKAIAQKSYAPATVTISNLTFYYNGLRRSGTYTFNSGTGNGDDKDNKAENSWEIDVTGGMAGSNSGNLVTTSATLSSIDPLDISGTARYLMLIPQENPDKTAFVTVAYTIKYPDDSDHDDVEVPSSDNTGRVYLPEIIWKPGIAYTYTLNIVAPKEMILDVSEEIDWGLEEPVNIFHP